MKILAQTETVCFPFIGDYIGGSHLSALGLIRNLDRQRFTPLVVLHHPDGPVAEIFRQENVQFEVAPIQNNTRHGSGHRRASAVASLRILPALVRYLKARNVAIVHTNDGRTHLSWGLAACFSGSKHLWHHRNDGSSFGLRWAAPLLADRVVAVSRFASPPPGFFSAAGKCSVVHSPFDVSRAIGIDRARRRSAALAELGCTPETRLLGYVGSLVERKRPLMFVDTLASIKRIASDVKVAGLFLGSSLNGIGELARSRAEELGIADSIHFLGFRYPAEDWIAALDVLLVPAVDEPLGRTLIEAMLLGTPVVAANSGGTPEAVQHGETGLLVPPDEPNEFAKACLTLFQDSSTRNAIVDRARGRASVQFNVERHIREISRIYEQLLAMGRSGEEPVPG
jgi:glycosyltransferase involved in cell wall biosynthesis